MILVIDFGSQYTELLVKKIREINVFSEIKEWNASNLLEEAVKYDALIISGSPHSAKDELHEEIFKDLVALKKPMLCVCYGMQVIHKIMGGKVVYGECPEFGNTKVRIHKDHPIVDGLPVIFKSWMSHNDSVTRVAVGFTNVASTDSCCSIAADDIRKIYTLQFHPEVEHSYYGERILKNFLFLICRIKENWKLENVIQKKIKNIKEQVGNEKVYLAFSGGLDSSVVAKLLQKSDVDTHLIFVDTGLLWNQKIKPTLDYLRSEFDDRLIVVNAQDKFLSGLKGITDPEEKRNTVGSLFLEVFKEEVKKLGDGKLLAQGTIHSDLIESGRKNQAHTIKTHHNTIEGLRKTFNLIEPIADLFKDEVKKLAVELDLPGFLVNSQPFPGTGYAIRILGEVTKEKIEILRSVDRILFQELSSRNLYSSISQCFSVMVGNKSVGVSGDIRKYDYVVALRAIDSSNMMTAKPSLIPIEVLTEISGEITNQIPNVTRVVYDLTSKPPATIEWE